MKPILSTKKWCATALYVIGGLFAGYIAYIILMGQTSFNLQGLLICGGGITIPIAIASYLLVSSSDNQQSKYIIMRIFTLCIFGVYLLLLSTVLFFNTSRMMDFEGSVSLLEYMKYNTNLIPFRTIGSYLSRGLENSFVLENLFGNLLLFTPMALFLPCLFKKLQKFIPFAVTLFSIILCVEVIQIISHCGSGDVDDILLNMVGGLCFYGLLRMKLFQRLLKKLYLIK